MPFDGKQWLLDNRRKTKRRNFEPIHWLYMGVTAGLAILFFSIDITRDLWLGWGMAAVFLLGSWPTKHGPGFLVRWDKYQHAHRRKAPEEESDAQEVSKNGKKSTRKAGKEGKDVKERKLKAPIPVRTMEYHSTVTGTDTGVLYSIPRIADGAIIATTGFDGALLDPDEFFDRQESMSESIIDVARSSVDAIGVVAGFMRRPYNPVRHSDWQEDNVHKKVMASIPGTTWQQVEQGKSYEAVMADLQRVFDGNLDRRLTTDEVLNLEMMQRDGLKEQNSHEAYCFYGITVPRDPSWPLGHKGDINDVVTQQQLNDARIVRLSDLMEIGLVANGALGVHKFNERELGNHLRLAWDLNPNTIKPWHEGANRTLDGKPFDPNNPWPYDDFHYGVDDKGFPYVNYGGTLHRIYVVSGLENKLARPRQYRDLFQPGYLGPADRVGYGVALVGETVLASEESRAATREIRFKKAVRRFTGRDSGDYDESELERQEAQLRENERDAFDFGGSHALQFNLYIDIAVSGPNEKDNVKLLMEADEKFRLVIRNQRVHADTVELAPHMNRALWSMYGAAGLI